MWGGDYNRPADKLEEECCSRYCAVRTHPLLGIFGTCNNGGLIDYFVTHEDEHCLVQDINIIKDAVVSPQSPLEGDINAELFRTRVKQQKVAPQLLQAEKVHENYTWTEAQDNLLSMGWKTPGARYQDKHQEYYAQHIGWQTAGMHMADIYSMWSATNFIQMMSAHTRGPAEYENIFG